MEVSTTLVSPQYLDTTLVWQPGFSQQGIAQQDAQVWSNSLSCHQVIEMFCFVCVHTNVRKQVPVTYSLLVESLSKTENMEMNCIVSGDRKVIEH